MKKFNVTMFYTGFCTYVINAKDEETAIDIAMNEDINVVELLSNISSLDESNTADEIE